MDGSAVVNPSVSPILSGKSNLRRNVLLVSILVLILISGVIVFFFTQNKGKKEPTVSLTKEYNNPFDAKTQYTNPFSDYKNQFDNLIK